MDQYSIFKSFYTLIDHCTILLQFILDTSMNKYDNSEIFDDVQIGLFRKNQYNQASNGE